MGIILRKKKLTSKKRLRIIIWCVMHRLNRHVLVLYFLVAKLELGSVLICHIAI